MAEAFARRLSVWISRVDEVGLAALVPGGGHGGAGSANLSHVELFAYPVLQQLSQSMAARSIIVGLMSRDSR
jgi:hypothetical protein